MKYFETETVTVPFYTHGLNTPIIQAFVAFFERWEETRDFVVVMSEKEVPGLKLSQRTNFQKLKHFGLIKSIKGKNGYVPTGLGISFYKGDVSCPNIVATRKNKAVPYDHPCWETHKATAERKFIYEYLSMSDYSWKTRKEYQSERSTVPTLF